jgi:N-acetylmuramoyl-L-alanine amidase
MATDYTIEQGDHLSKIADQFGFFTIWPIWNHPKNEELRQVRGTPNVLLPGDVVHVPDRVTNVVTRSTGSSHVFRVRTMDLLVRVVLLDSRFQPMPDVTCELNVAGPAPATSTDAQGTVSKSIPKTAKSGKLVVGERILPVQVGHLDPGAEISGAQARLNALGYDAGDSNDASNPQFRSAIEEFQCDLGMEVSGELDATTVTRLVELHGC